MEKRDFLKMGVLTMAGLLLPRKTSALEYYPTTKETDWAVLYGTWCGTARDAGVWISEGMNGIANVFDVRGEPRSVEIQVCNYWRINQVGSDIERVTGIT